MNEFIVALQSNLTLLVILFGLLGLIVGSFLNVVICRLPIMLDYEWRRECCELLNVTDQNKLQKKSINLLFPRSHCPKCKTPIRALHNIPIVSFILLKGKCASCHAKIMLRYPIVETLTALMSGLLAARYGLTWQLAAAFLFSWSLIVLIFIDLEHQLLPDIITLPLLWLGLLVNLENFYTSYSDALIGAVAGYLILWFIMWGYKLFTKRIGMGHGDFKLLACLGAWLGWQQLPLILLLASGTGAIAGLSFILLRKQHRYTPIPFGPYLAFAGWFGLMWGTDIIHWYLKLLNIT